MAQVISKATGTTTTGYEGRTDYSAIYCVWDKISKYVEGGGGIIPATNQPQPGQKNDKSGPSVLHTYTKGEEKK